MHNCITLSAYAMHTSCALHDRLPITQQRQLAEQERSQPVEKESKQSGLWRDQSSGEIASLSGASWRPRWGALVGRQYCSGGQ